MAQEVQATEEALEALGAACEAMQAKGADRAQAQLVLSEKTELEVDADVISLLRTTSDTRLTLTAIAENRRGSITVNRLDGSSVEEAAAQAVAYAVSSPADPAYDIAPRQEAEKFQRGPREPDRDLMYRHMEAFLHWAAQRYPKTRLEQTGIDFLAARSFFRNTNGVRFESDTGRYAFGAVFTSKEGKKTSCMNYTESAQEKLEEPFQRWAGLEELMGQSMEQLDAVSLKEKFVGDIIFTPHCLLDLMEFINFTFLSDMPMIRGTSPFKDSLGKQVAAPIVTLRSCPVSPLIHEGYFFTPDGFRSADSAIIDKGILAGYTLSLFGARKTDRPRPPNAGGCWVVDPGTSTLEEMVGATDRGLLLCRFSCDGPSPLGDISGVAKNSYLIEGGRIARPVTETTVAGNLADLLLSISAVTTERIDFGRALLPWIRATGVTVSGKEGQRTS